MLPRWKYLYGSGMPWLCIRNNSSLAFNRAVCFQPADKKLWLSNARFTHSKNREKGRNENQSSAHEANKLKLQNADMFGTLGGEKYENSSGLQDNDGEDDFLAKISDTERPRPFDYLRKIETLVEPPVVDLKQALEIFEVEMKKEYVKPIPEIYRVLINACGRKGYSDKAFELYRQYTSRKFPVNFGIFADLFNACANCPKSEEDNGFIEARALRHAKALYFKLFSQFNGNLPPEVYHNMIKAFGRCGDVESAFDLLDKMGEKRVVVNASTIAHVLQACISDKDAGFRHALLVWRKMRRYKIKPNVHCYNLLLRTVKECGMGDSTFLQDILIEAMSPKDVRHMKKQLGASRVSDNKNNGAENSFNGNENILHEDVKSKQDKNIDIVIVSSNSEENGNAAGKPYLANKPEHKAIQFNHRGDETKFPNFLAPRPQFECDTSIVGLSDNAMSTAQNKFALFRNVSDFLDLMTNVDHIHPDIKTLSQLLHCIDPSEEQILVQCVRKYKVKPDVDFFNQLIRKRVARREYELARSTLEDIMEFDLAPDIATFGCLSMACTNDILSKNLIREMRANGLRPNIQILTALLRNSCYRFSVEHIEMLLSVLSKQKITPNAQTIQTLEYFYHKYKNVIVLLERHGVGENDYLQKNQRLVKMVHKDLQNGSPKWKSFINNYKIWLEKTELECPSHPWKQFLTSKDLELGKSGPKGKQKYIHKIVNNS